MGLGFGGDREVVLRGVVDKEKGVGVDNKGVLHKIKGLEFLS